MKFFNIIVLHVCFGYSITVLPFDHVYSLKKSYLQKTIDNIFRLKYRIEVINKAEYPQAFFLLKQFWDMYPFQLRGVSLLMSSGQTMFATTTLITIPKCWVIELEQGNYHRLEEIEFMLLRLSLDLKRRLCEKRFVEIVGVFSLLGIAIAIYIVKNPDCIKECIQDYLMMGYQHYKK